MSWNCYSVWGQSRPGTTHEPQVRARHAKLRFSEDRERRYLGNVDPEIRKSRKSEPNLAKLLGPSC
jgi:hypothetical protein